MGSRRSTATAAGAPVRPLRIVRRQRALRAGRPLQWRPASPPTASAHGSIRPIVLARAVGLDMVAGRLAADRRQLSRPRHQAPHPRSGARGEGRAVGAAHRPSEEGRYGQGGRTAARRHRLAAGAAASGGDRCRRSRTPAVKRGLARIPRRSRGRSHRGCRRGAAAYHRG